MDGKVGLTLGISLCVSLVFAIMQKHEKILISDSAKMLILAYYDKENDTFKESVDESVVGAIFLNALSKYEVGNPYKKNLNHNNPFKLLLSLLKRLKNAHLTPYLSKKSLFYFVGKMITPMGFMTTLFI